MSQEKTVSLNQLVWRTRGRHWGFKLLCFPDTQPEDSWRAALSSVLDEGNEGTKPRHGTLSFANGLEVYFAAITVIDGMQLDGANRPIVHQFLLNYPSNAVQELPADWGNQLLGQLGPPLYEGEAFKLSSDDLDGWVAEARGQSLSTYIRQVVCRRCPQVLHLTEKPVDPSGWLKVSWQEEKKTPQAQTMQPHSQFWELISHLKRCLLRMVRRLLGR